MFSVDFATEETLPLSLSLAVLGSGPLILDFKRRDSQRLYSYPSEIRTSAEIGKTYHFWMSAYLTYRLSNEMGNSHAAGVATWLSEQGYQAISTTALRTPEIVFDGHPFTAYNNRIRVDLAFAEAGIRFGASKSRAKNAPVPNIIDVDERISALFKAAKPVSHINASVAKKWLEGGAPGLLRYQVEWLKLFSPDAAWNIDY